MKIRVVADMLEELWPSMDLFAEMLVRYLPQASPPIDLELFRLPLKRRLSTRSGARGSTLDRLMGRHFDYPQELRRSRTDADIDHIVDQTYAVCARSLRGGRTVITCHDLDAFSPLSTRPRRLADRILTMLAKRTLKGLKSAAHVVCVSEVVKTDILARGWLPAQKVSVIPGGVHPTFSERADTSADARVDALLGPRLGPEILHVGSTIPRKRIDTLLETFAAVRKARPEARLLRAGGALTNVQRQTASRLRLADAIVPLPFQDREDLAALYRRATLVVLPSQSEGFGLPLIEAMACGTPVLASALDVFREVAGDATAYAPVGEAPQWVRAILELLDEREQLPSKWAERISRGLLRAQRYSWAEHAQRLSEVYASLLATDGEQ